MKKINLAIKAIVAAMVVFMVVVVVQIYQFTKICDEKREVAIQLWAKTDTNSERILSNYRSCVKGDFAELCSNGTMNKD